ncbi:MAG: DUF6456 domain-containing protein [Alphaproteobacteria bacterium]
MRAEGEFRREARRILPRLRMKGAHLRAVGKDGFGLFAARNRFRKPVAAVEAGAVRAFLSRGLIEAGRAPAGSGGVAGPVYVLGAAGEAWLRRDAARGDNPHAEQHRLMAVKTIAPEGRAMREALVNEGESPVGWLARRKGPGGKALLSAAACDAAEKLREDFTLARLTPRVTADWSLAPGTAPKGRGGAGALAVTEAAVAARERVRRALEAVGPGLADALLQVCCHLKGLEEAERALGWPRRSGKLVLAIALERLAVHYGMKT